LSAQTQSPGVIAAELDGRGIARLAARKGQGARMAALFRAEFGIEPPRGPRRASRDGLAIAGIGPDTWLATREGAGHSLAQSLQALLGPCASICDQSDAYVMLRLCGPRVRELLAKLVPLDVHARSFPVSAVARTVCGYVGVTLWRLADAADGSAVFEIWAGRSLGVSLHGAIAHGAAEFGYVRAAPGPAGARLEG
jgi:methylglutamate dehydrogenase subunit D